VCQSLILPVISLFFLSRWCWHGRSFCLAIPRFFLWCSPSVWSRIFQMVIRMPFYFLRMKSLFFFPPRNLFPFPFDQGTTPGHDVFFSLFLFRLPITPAVRARPYHPLSFFFGFFFYPYRGHDPARPGFCSPKASLDLFVPLILSPFPRSSAAIAKRADYILSPIVRAFFPHNCGTISFFPFQDDGSGFLFFPSFGLCGKECFNRELLGFFCPWRLEFVLFLSFCRSGLPLSPFIAKHYLSLLGC